LGALFNLYIMTHIIDAHQDLAYNILTFGRDYRRSAHDTRRLEENTLNPERGGHTLLGWPDFQLGQVAVIFSTVFAAPRRYQTGEWDTQVFANPAEARLVYHAQLEVYRRLCGENPDMFRLVQTRKDIQAVIKEWQTSPADFPTTTHPTGLVLLLEGGEGVRDVSELEEWWQAGVRILGPVWAGTRWCGAMYEPGEFTAEGFDFLDGMADLGFILDVSHMNNQSTLQALERYSGAVIASHSNARSLLDDSFAERHLTDAAIHGLIERDGVIGVVGYNRYLQTGWAPGDPLPPLTVFTNQIDHICQIAGNSLHVGIGTDFDGGFGWRSVPAQIDTIADLQKLIPLLIESGYEPDDIENIMGGNWKRFLERNLPV
jgi:membrane dipeptidase